MKEGSKTKKKLKVPPAFALLVIMIFIAVLASWLLPAGQFDRVVNDAGKSLVVPGSYHTVDRNPASIWDGFTAIPKGLINSATIIFAVFLIGGSFKIIESTGILQSVLGGVSKVFRGKEMLMIPIVMICLSVMCSFIGLLELSMVVIPIMIPVCLALGMDSMTAVAIPLISTAAGFACGVANPFTVVIAQGIAELPLYSGSAFRAICLVIITAIGVWYVIRYAAKIRKSPESSIMFERDKELRIEYGVGEVVEFTTRRKLGLAAFIIGFIVIIIGAMKFSWALVEISTVFIIIALACSVLTGMSLEDICGNFSKGLASFSSAALVSGFAAAITLILSNANVIDTIINAVANLVAALPSSIAAVGMLIVQFLFNFIVPSGSGQALISMPIMIPLSDIIGVTRQTAIIAYQFGDGLSNILWPTLGYLWICIGAAKIKYEEWVKFIGPLILIWYVVCAILLVVAQGIGLA